VTTEQQKDGTEKTDYCADHDFGSIPSSVHKINPLRILMSFGEGQASIPFTV
jgi:hypothetical protein